MVRPVRPLTYEEYRREGYPALLRVFATPDPYEPDLAPGAEVAAIVYPLQFLDEQQLRAVATAAMEIADEALHLSTLERLPSLSESFYIPLDEVGELAPNERVAAARDHVVHSSSGAWGLVMSWEAHAIVAGEARFVATLLERLPLDADDPAGESVRAWLEDSRELYDAMRSDREPWVPRLTVRVYGRERGAELLRAHGWSDFVPD